MKDSLVRLTCANGRWGGAEVGKRIREIAEDLRHSRLMMQTTDKRFGENRSDTLDCQGRANSPTKAKTCRRQLSSENCAEVH
jgi:hypothetical protein